MRFYARCALHRLVYPSRAYFPHPLLRNALIRALSQIRVDTATTPEGLIHFLKTDKAICIVFFDDDLPPEGSNHVRPLFIDVACAGCRVSSVILDNGSALNLYPLVIAIVLGYSPTDFRLSS